MGQTEMQLREEQTLKNTIFWVWGMGPTLLPFYIGKSYVPMSSNQNKHGWLHSYRIKGEVKNLYKQEHLLIWIHNIYFYLKLTFIAAHEAWIKFSQRITINDIKLFKDYNKLSWAEAHPRFIFHWSLKLIICICLTQFYYLSLCEPMPAWICR